MGGISVGIGTGVRPAHLVVAGSGNAAGGIGDRYCLAIIVVGICPGVPHSIGHGEHTSGGIIGILSGIPVGIGAGDLVTALIIGIGGRAAQRIRDRCDMILGIIGIGRDITHEVAFGQVETVAIHREYLLISGGIGGFD